MFEIPQRGEVSASEQLLRRSFLDELHREVVSRRRGTNTLEQARNRILDLIRGSDDEEARQALALLVTGYLRVAEFAASFKERVGIESDQTSAICRAVEGLIGDEFLSADNPPADYERLQQLVEVLVDPATELRRAGYEYELVQQTIAGYKEMFVAGSPKRYVASNVPGHDADILFIEIPRAEYVLKSSQGSSSELSV